jgi:hypothetical protein
MNVPRARLATRIAGCTLLASFVLVIGCNGMMSSITGIENPHVRPAATVGVAGLTLRSPTAPIQPDGEPGRAPVGGVTVELRNGQGSVAGSATSGDDGRFIIEAAAGAYTLRATPPAQLYHQPALDIPITVPENGMAEITLTFDSGIR